MGNQHEGDRRARQTCDSISPNIVGRFCIQDRQYLVICVKSCLKDLIESANISDYPYIIPDAVIGRFTANAQYCVIVETEPSSSGLNSDVTTLLTERELQIVHLVAAGHPNKQIACQLHISEWTVSTHLRRIFAKLGVDSRAAMVYRCAVRLATSRGN
jgi:DNA-binding CsgD family transcriptional regulator